MTPEYAETIALQALVHVLQDHKIRNIFLDKTGLDEGALREGVKDTEHLAGILDYILSDENLLTNFCKQFNLSPEHAVKAWRALSRPAPEL